MWWEQLCSFMLFQRWICRKCKKPGHFANMCRSRNSPMPFQTQGRKKAWPHQSYHVEEEIHEHYEPECAYTMNKLSNQSADSMMMDIEMNGYVVIMEMDTGLLKSIISDSGHIGNCPGTCHYIYGVDCYLTYVCWWASLKNWVALAYRLITNPSRWSVQY